MRPRLRALASLVAAVVNAGTVGIEETGAIEIVIIVIEETGGLVRLSLHHCRVLMAPCRRKSRPKR